MYITWISHLSHVLTSIVPPSELHQLSQLNTPWKNASGHHRFQNYARAAMICRRSKLKKSTSKHAQKKQRDPMESPYLPNLPVIFNIFNIVIYSICLKFWKVFITGFQAGSRQTRHWDNIGTGSGSKTWTSGSCQAAWGALIFLMNHDVPRFTGAISSLLMLICSHKSLWTLSSNCSKLDTGPVAMDWILWLYWFASFCPNSHLWLMSLILKSWHVLLVSHTRHGLRMSEPWLWTSAKSTSQRCPQSIQLSYTSASHKPCLCLIFYCIQRIQMGVSENHIDPGKGWKIKPRFFPVWSPVCWNAAGNAGNWSPGSRVFLSRNGCGARLNVSKIATMQLLQRWSSDNCSSNLLCFQPSHQLPTTSDLVTTWYSNLVYPLTSVTN